MIDEPVPTMPLMVPATSPTARTKSKFKALFPVIANIYAIIRLARTAKFVEADQGDSTSPVIFAKIFSFPPTPNQI
jgi:hypothetical protein